MSIVCIGIVDDANCWYNTAMGVTHGPTPQPTINIVVQYRCCQLSPQGVQRLLSVGDAQSKQDQMVLDKFVLSHVHAKSGVLIQLVKSASIDLQCASGTCACVQ